MKFCIGQDEINAAKAGQWCVTALAGLCEDEDGRKSRNGLTRTAAMLQRYFLQLEVLGLVERTRGALPEERRFRPRFASPSELRSYIAQHPPSANRRRTPFAPDFAFLARYDRTLHDNA